MRLKYSKLTEQQTDMLLEQFVEGTPARTAADQVHLNRNTVRGFYHKIREIAAWRTDEKWSLDGDIELDESYFHAVGEGIAGRIALFGIVGRGGKFFTKAIPFADSQQSEDPLELPPVQRKKIFPDSIVYTDNWRQGDTVDIADLKHRIYRSRLADGQRPQISGIAEFWNRVREHLIRYNGVPRRNFHLFLKESEWRVNNGPPEQTREQQLEQLKRWIRMHGEREPPPEEPPRPRNRRIRIRYRR